jgi:hypothetical protein
MPGGETAMAEQEFPWPVPVCPVCGSELDAVPISSGHGLRVSFICERHGPVSLPDPFDLDNDPSQ